MENTNEFVYICFRKTESQIYMSQSDKQNKISSTTIADIVGCSDRNVRNAWNSTSEETRKKPQTLVIQEVTEFMNDGINKLIKEAKKRVKF